MRRLVLIFPGFEPLSAEATARRFLRGLGQAAPLYGLATEASAPVTTEVGGGLQASTFAVRTGGEAATETQVVVYGLGAVNHAYAARGTLERIAQGFAALGDFLLTGTFLRFLRTSWRYGLFYLFPIVAWVFLIGLAGLAFHLLRPWSLALALTGAAAVFLGLFWAFNRQFHLLLLMDDWCFARDLARGRNLWVNELTAAINADAAARVGAFDGDEVVIAAHSLGAVPAVGALAHALRGPGPSSAAGLMTVGSSLLKIALHPAAARLRADVGEVLRSPCPWLDVQSVSDPISFYRSDPAASLRLGPVGRVRILRISFHEQLDDETYKRMKLNLFRLHRQFVRAVEKRSRYSFHVILCGPAPFSAVAGGKRAGLREAAAGKGS